MYVLGPIVALLFAQLGVKIVSFHKLIFSAPILMTWASIFILRHFKPTPNLVGIHRWDSP